MTIPVSTAPQAMVYALGAIKSALSTDSAYGSMYVGLAIPGPDVSNEIVCITGETNRQVQRQSFVGSMGALSLEEVYEIEVCISAFNDQSDPAVVLNRAWTLAGYVDQAIRNDPTFGGLVLIAYPSSTVGGEVTPIGQPSGLQVNLTTSIRVEATI
jgi:hypothetical protein